MCFIRQALDRVAAVPGVESASGINHLPLAGDLWTFSFAVEGRPAPPPSQEPSAAFRVVFPGYFHTMRIPLLRGRDFTARDDADAPARVVIVNETMARRYWPGEDAIGKRIRLGSTGPWYTVVGHREGRRAERLGRDARQRILLLAAARIRTTFSGT